MTTKMRRVIKYLIALVLVALGVAMVVQSRFPDETSGITRSITDLTKSVKQTLLALPGQAGEVTAETAAPPMPTAIQLDCPADPQPIANPVYMTLVSQRFQLPMISLGLDADGAAASPPDNQGYTVAWFNQGPLVGSRQGRAVLTSHTFFRGGALGNELNTGLLAAGDIIRFSDAEGNAACYRYSGSLRIVAADYDPESDVLYDSSGAPQIGLIVCSDYTSSGEALGRAIYYADLVTEATAAG